MKFWPWSKPRITYQDPDLGEFEYQHGLVVWFGRESVEGVGEDLLIDVPGDKTRPNEDCLRRAGVILRGLGVHHSKAVEYLKGQDLGMFSDPLSGTMTCAGFTVLASPDEFELEFGLSKWPDASITVIFHGGKPVDVRCSD